MIIMPCIQGPNSAVQLKVAEKTEDTLSEGPEGELMGPLAHGLVGVPAPQSGGPDPSNLSPLTLYCSVGTGRAVYQR
jgi:hypothetical protein